jgi:hypothetical protein
MLLGLLALFCGADAEPKNLANYYLENLDTIQTPEQRNEAILKCLAQIGSIVDNAASIQAIQAELTGKFNGVMMALDSRDRDLKTRYSKIYDSLNSLEDRTSSSINQTFTKVSESVRGVRTTMISKLAESIETALSKGRNAAAEVEHNVAGAVEGHQQTSLIMALVYFGIFQVLLAISLYLIRAYVKNEELAL